jgi:hypothetical protein
MMIKVDRFIPKGLRRWHQNGYQFQNLFEKQNSWGVYYGGGPEQLASFIKAAI